MPARQTIFHNANDAHLFLTLVAQSHTMHDVEVHAYCLMSNHFTCFSIVRRAGCRLHATARIYLYEIRRTKTVEQTARSSEAGFGRWCVIPPSTSTSLAATSIGIRSMQRRDRPLDEWRWSSYSAYVGRSPRPHWLTTSTALAWHDGTNGYQRFVESDQSVDGNLFLARWGWAVDTAIAEYERDNAEAPTQQFRRSVTVAAAVLMNHAEGMSLFKDLGLMTTRSRREATRRAAIRTSQHPELSKVVVRAIELVG